MDHDASEKVMQIDHTSRYLHQQRLVKDCSWFGTFMDKELFTKACENIKREISPVRFLEP